MTMIPDELFTSLVGVVAEAIYEQDDNRQGTWPSSRDDDGYRGDRAHVRLATQEEQRQARTQAAAAIRALMGHKLVEAALSMQSTIESLLRWAHEMGGWDAPCWHEAETALARLKAEAAALE